MFDWQDMRYFLAVAKAGSLTAAARALGVDHATVGRRVARLEGAIEAKLPHRLPRSTRLTDAGAALVQAAAAMEGGADAAVRYLRGQTDGAAGSVTVSGLPAIAAFAITPGLPRLLDANPGLRLTLSTTLAIASLERGEADIAIGFVRPDRASRIVRQLMTVRFALYGAPGIVACPSADWTFIGFEEALADIVQQAWLNDYAAGRPFVLRTNDVATQAQAASAGLGVALLPCLVGDAVPGLIRLETSVPPPSRPLWMSVHADVRRSAAVRIVMDHMVRCFGVLSVEHA